MLLCDYCGDEILSNSQRVTVYHKDEDVCYVPQGGDIPEAYEQVTVCVHGDNVIYTRQGSNVPRGYESVSVYVKEQELIYSKERTTLTGFVPVRVYAKKEDSDTASCTNSSKPKQIIHTACLTEHIPWCDEAVSNFLQCSSTENILTIGIHVKYLYGVGRKDDNKKKKREKRDRKLHQLSEKVSALRNSNSGCILVHLVGLAPGDHFTGAFDEFVDTKLHDLIHDGQLFTDVYRKEKLSGHRVLCDFDDFLALYVTASSFVTTSDFYTKVALDDCIVDIPAEELRTFISKKGEFEGTSRKLPTEIHTVNDVVRVHESRSIQMKSHFLQKKGDHEIVAYIIKNLNLTEYISALSKLENGGSYLYGVKEECVFKSEYGYESKEIRLQPVCVDDQDYLKDTLKQKICETVLVCDFDGKKVTDAHTVDIRFIPCSPNEPCCSDELRNHKSETKERYIIHILVKHVKGVVFYDSQGPLAYKYDPTNKSVTRMEIHEWFHAFTRGK